MLVLDMTTHHCAYPQGTGSFFKEGRISRSIFSFIFFPGLIHTDIDYSWGHFVRLQRCYCIRDIWDDLVIGGTLRGNTTVAQRSLDSSDSAIGNSVMNDVVQIVDAIFSPRFETVVTACQELHRHSAA